MGILFLSLVALSADDTAKKNELPARARAILEKAEQVELFSLDPTREVDKKAASFHGYFVLGSTTLKDKAARGKVLDALDRGIRDSKGLAAECFDPRHGLRATHDGKTVDLAICFHCLQIEVFYERDSTKWDNQIFTAGSPEPILDKVLRDAGVTLAPKAN